MNNMNNYILQYGNVSHILNININNEICDNNEKNIRRSFL